MSWQLSPSEIHTHSHTHNSLSLSIVFGKMHDRHGVGGVGLNSKQEIVEKNRNVISGKWTFVAIQN